jgi:putative tryptophan/tyrosine transport system substrate-binding protein
MKRRAFIALLGAASAIGPFAVCAQQKAMPVIGYLSAGLPGPAAPFVAAFRRGLSETGYVDGQNVAIEYAWAEGNYDRLPGLAADLVNRKVDVLAATGGTPTIMAAKGATSTIPIVFLGGGDLVADRVVTSLARPGGNLTGISLMAIELNEKRLDLLSEIVPQASVIALLANPNSPSAKRMIGDEQKAARVKGLRLNILNAGSDSEIEAAFTSVAQQRAGALVVMADPFFNSRRERLVALASRYAVPAIYEWREFAEAGGLISYGPSQVDLFRQVGAYCGRILGGANPADLPIQQPTKFELVINLKTAKALGLTVPQSLLARAEEVIE